MTIGAWLAGLLLAIGPNGALVEARLAAAGPAYHDLVPVEWLGATPSSLWLVFHRRDDWVMAAYLPADAAEMSWARAFPDVAASQFDRLLPGLDVPRLFLRESVYRRSVEGGDGLVRVESLAVDSSEILFNALLDAHVDLAVRRGEAWTQGLGSRGRKLMTGVPDEFREEAFRNAVLDFGSHLLSLATEIARQSRRHPPGTLCALLDPPRVLFRSWQRALGDGQFPGRWQRPGGIVARRGTVTTRQTLRVDDKRWVVETILGARWSGDPAVDFAHFCRHGQ